MDYTIQFFWIIQSSGDYSERYERTKQDLKLMFPEIKLLKYLNDFNQINDEFQNKIYIFENKNKIITFIE